MQYENVFKGDRWCSCYTCLPQSAHVVQSVPRKVAPGTPPKDQRLLTIATPKQGPAHTHTCKKKENAKKQHIIT